MKSALVLVLALAVAPVLADEKKDKTGGKEPAKLIGFHKLDFDKALDKAKSDKKVIMIDFYTDWCGWCKVLDEKTFTDGKVQTFLKDKTIAIKLNAEAKEIVPIAKRYKVNAYPCVIFIDGEGKEVGRVEGYMPPDQFLAATAKFIK